MRITDSLPDGYDLNLFLINDQGKFKGINYNYQDHIESKRKLQNIRLDDDTPFAWSVKNMSSYNVEFQLNFTSPLEISEDYTRMDTLQLEFLTDKFISETTNKPLQIDEINNRVLELTIPQQFESQDALDYIESLTS